MDAQLKRGLLEVSVLKSLVEEDSYGYQIIKDITPYIDITESTLYPILRRLESANMLEVYSVEHKSRLRKYYKITEQGKEKILDFINDWQEVIKVFSFISGGDDGDKG